MLNPKSQPLAPVAYSLSPTPNVVVVGSANVDFVMRVARRPNVGETIAGEDLTILPGGKGANQAVAAARSGANVAFIGGVGTDSHGDLLLHTLSSEGVDLAEVRRHPGPSGVAIIVVTTDGENTIIIVPGANGQVSETQITEASALIAASNVCVLQGELGVATTHHAALLAHQAGARIVLNLAPVIDLPRAALVVSDPLVVNAHEAAILLGYTSLEVENAPQEAASSLKQLGPRSVIITLGPDGVVIVDDTEALTIPAPAVQAVDTTGAGDAFVGALAHSLAEGANLAAASRYAVAFASIAVTRRGAQASYPSQEDVELFISTKSSIGK